MAIAMPSIRVGESLRAYRERLRFRGEFTSDLAPTCERHGHRFTLSSPLCSGCGIDVRDYRDIAEGGQTHGRHRESEA